MRRAIEVDLRRLLGIVVLVSLLGGCVIMTRQLSEQPVAVESVSDTATPLASELALASNEECQPCHEEIYAEWQRDEHSRSWFNRPLLPQDPKRTECNNCHAPVPVLENGITALPKIRSDRHEEGVGCIECHRRGRHVEGPHVGLEGACAPTFNADLQSSRACESCHGPHGSNEELAASEFGRKGYTCQMCHMPIVEAPSTTGGEPRRRRSHTMLTGRDRDFFADGVALQVTKQEQLVIVVHNHGVGHNVPGEIHNREMFLATTFFDSSGTEMARHRESFSTVRREQRASLPSTQLRPGESRVFRYSLPKGPGKIHVRLGYKRLRFDIDPVAMTIHEKELEL